MAIMENLLRGAYRGEDKMRRGIDFEEFFALSRGDH